MKLHQCSLQLSDIYGYCLIFRADIANCGVSRLPFCQFVHINAKFILCDFILCNMITYYYYY